LKPALDGITPLGSTGEVMDMTPAQHRAIVLATIRAAAGRVPVVPGFAAFSTFDAVDRAKELEQSGANGVVVICPNVFPTSEEGVISYFSLVACRDCTNHALHQPSPSRQRFFH
jgi:4-hydroxy-tetrahydrodipicolinate synthase